MARFIHATGDIASIAPTTKLEHSPTWAFFSHISIRIPTSAPFDHGKNEINMKAHKLVYVVFFFGRIILCLEFKWNIYRKLHDSESEAEQTHIKYLINASPLHP